MCQRTSSEAVFFNLHTKKLPRDGPESWPGCAASSLDLISNKNRRNVLLFPCRLFFGGELFTERSSFLSQGRGREAPAPSGAQPSPVSVSPNPNTSTRSLEP